MTERSEQKPTNQHEIYEPLKSNPLTENGSYEISRRFALAYVLDRLDQVDHEQVEMLAKELENDRIIGKIRTLAEVIHAAGIISPEISEDVFLTHVALRYDESEMTREGADPTSLGSLADVLAGEGPQRPLFRELYSLGTLGAVQIHRSQDKEIFHRTNQTQNIGKNFRILFDYTPQIREKGVVILIDHSGNQALRRSRPELA